MPVYQPGTVYTLHHPNAALCYRYHSTKYIHYSAVVQGMKKHTPSSLGPNMVLPVLPLSNFHILRLLQQLVQYLDT
jgi:hypothetical protein